MGHRLMGPLVVFLLAASWPTWSEVKHQLEHPGWLKSSGCCGPNDCHWVSMLNIKAEGVLTYAKLPDGNWVWAPTKEIKQGKDDNWWVCYWGATNKRANCIFRPRTMG